ncbi:MAG: hypothetical protein PHO84_03280 [Dysgonamonadaceae bacterium]|jgi:hypothetical protein|nr:hypothetical protein [Dysgonamonadaceae bacterium]HUI32418.1 hypothetical protein [Dysgonamonadaceae bacterium]
MIQKIEKRLNSLKKPDTEPSFILKPAFGIIPNYNIFFHISIFSNLSYQTESA